MIELKSQLILNGINLMSILLEFVNIVKEIARRSSAPMLLNEINKIRLTTNQASELNTNTLGKVMEFTRALVELIIPKISGSF